MSANARIAKAQKEGRNVLALHALRTGQISSGRAAARVYKTPKSTLSDRTHGRVARVDSRANNRKLTETEELVLIQWILDMDARGYPPRICAVREAAQLLLRERAGLSAASIGQNWPRNFINRQPQLQAKYTRSYDYQRAQCEDPEKMRAWFRLVSNTMHKYGIVPNDIYNFDEIGYAMGVIGTTRVVTSSDRRGRPTTLQPGNREWVTSIEGVNAYGWSLPPMLVFAGKVHISTWYENEEIPRDWAITLSETGWTNDKVGLEWIRTIFDPITAARAVGKYRLLILDGHSSHATPEFDQFCKDRCIITLCMPPHSSHLLQPLDVGCFSPLKTAYRRQVAENAKLGINHVDKPEFLSIYKEARAEALSAENIRSGFRATGLVPIDPEQVLSRLHITFRTPSPVVAETGPWQSETPHNLEQLQQQTTLLQNLLKRRSHSPPSPTEQALRQLVKGCQMAMHSAVLLASENSKLRTANERQKAKRQTRRSYIANSGTLTVAKGAELVQREKEVINPAIEVRGAAPLQRAQPRCSKCNSSEHTARTCKAS